MILMATWSDLPLDLLGSILFRLPSVDRLRFGSVCTSWRSAAGSHLFPPAPQPPWLMLPFNTAKNATRTAARFFSLADRRTYTIPQPLPPISGRLCIGSSHGWLITADHTSELHLLNPATGSQIPLPSVTTFPFVGAVRDPDGRAVEYTIRYGGGMRESIPPDRLRYFLYEKAILSADPSSGGYAVMLIHNPLSKLAFAGAGDETWTSLQTPNSHWADAIVSSEGKFCTLESRGRVDSWDLTGPFPRPTTIAPPCLLGCYDCDRYLVELPPEGLLQVWRRREQAQCKYNWEPRPVYVEYVTKRVEILKLGSKGEGWVTAGRKDGRLRGHALFLGKNCSSAVSVSECPELRGNCIYFTDDRTTTFEKCHNVVPDVGVFDLQDGSFKPCGGCDFQSIWPPAIWITPSLL